MGHAFKVSKSTLYWPVSLIYCNNANCNKNYNCIINCLNGSCSDKLPFQLYNIYFLLLHISRWAVLFVCLFLGCIPRSLCSLLFSLCLHGISAGSPVSSHSPSTCVRGHLETLNQVQETYVCRKMTISIVKLFLQLEVNEQ